MQNCQPASHTDGISGHTVTGSIVHINDRMGIILPLERRSDGLLMGRTRRKTDLDAKRARHGAFGILHFFADLYILLNGQPPTRSQNRCCIITNMPDDADARSGPSSAVGSPDANNGRRQQSACLSCREAKQKCSKGVPW
jgi:hypothetical protein